MENQFYLIRLRRLWWLERRLRRLERWLLVERRYWLDAKQSSSARMQKRTCINNLYSNVIVPFSSQSKTENKCGREPMKQTKKTRIFHFILDHQIE